VMGEQGKLDRQLRRISLITAIGTVIITTWSIIEAMTCSGFMCGLVFLFTVLYVTMPGTAFLSLLLYSIAYFSASNGGMDREKRLVKLFMKYTAILLTASLLMLFLQNLSIQVSDFVFTLPLYHLWLIAVVAWIVGLIALNAYLFVKWLKLGTSGIKWPLLALLLPIVGSAIYLALFNKKRSN